MRAGDRRLVLVVVLRLHLGRLLLLLVVVFTLIYIDNRCFTFAMVATNCARG